MPLDPKVKELGDSYCPQEVTKCLQQVTCLLLSRFTANNHICLVPYPWRALCASQPAMCGRMSSFLQLTESHAQYLIIFFKTVCYVLAIKTRNLLSCLLELQTQVFIQTCV